MSVAREARIQAEAAPAAPGSCRAAEASGTGSPPSAVASGHYDRHYFDWQKNIGAFGGIANKIKFEAFIRPDDNVIDFGCGGGYLLENLTCRGKIGIEINPTAAAQARDHGLTTHASVEGVPDGWADVIVSNNALEHTEQPLTELTRLYPKLRPGGLLVLVVPCESIRYAYRPRDINQHLYSFSPMCIGNLCTRAGFEVIRSEPFLHKWPPRYATVMQLLGLRLFHVVCRVYSRWERSWFQVRVVARRPETA